MELWKEAQEIAASGPKRAVGILQLFAEEEAAKTMLLFDAVRCPPQCRQEFRRLVRGFGDHLAKGIYVAYYGSRLTDLAKARRIIDHERQSVHREGEYDEWITPNSILYMREKRLYVSYIRNDDNTHEWRSPYPPNLVFGNIKPSFIIRVVEALNSVGLFSEHGLGVVSDFWRGRQLVDPVADDDLQEVDSTKNVSWGQARAWNIEMLRKWENERGEPFQENDENFRIVADELLFPLYPFDLTSCGDVRDLPPPRWPVEM
jgi:hypothetical protein